MEINRVTTEIWRRWAPFSPALIGILQTALEQSEFRFFSGTLPVPKDAFYLPADKKLLATRVKGLILFTEEFGALVSLEKWNQLGDLSMAGFGIHEALRTIQIVYKLNISDEFIQNLTSQLVLGVPCNLENKNIIGNDLMALVENVRRHGLGQFADQFDKFKRSPRYALLESMTMMYLLAQDFYKDYPPEVEEGHLRNASEINNAMNKVLLDYKRQNK